MRAIPADLDPRVVADIDATLDTIVRDDGVSIPWAIESGSRAWGFPSPDSDYDCRFLYVRPGADYLSIWPRRDVIETPLVGVLDVNGRRRALSLRALWRDPERALDVSTDPDTFAPVTLSDHPRIAINSGICGGRPIVAGTRMRVSDVLEMLAGGASAAEIAADFPYVSEDDVRAVLAYAAAAV